MFDQSAPVTSLNILLTSTAILLNLQHEIGEVIIGRLRKFDAYPFTPEVDPHPHDSLSLFSFSTTIDTYPESHWGGAGSCSKWQINLRQALLSVHERGTSSYSAISSSAIIRRRIFRSSVKMVTHILSAGSVGSDVAAPYNRCREGIGLALLLRGSRAGFGIPRMLIELSSTFGRVQTKKYL
jgi:hypothetical protein